LFLGELRFCKGCGTHAAGGCLTDGNCLPTEGFPQIEKRMKSGKVMLLTDPAVAHFVALKIGKYAKCLI
jgi:hypothetical protein